MKKIISDKELGTIVFSKNMRAKRLIIRLKPDCIAVTMPYYSTYNDALKFVNSKRDWIVSRKDSVKLKRQLISNDEPLTTLTFQVRLQSGVRKGYFISLKDKILTVEYPEFIDPASDSAQQIFRKAVENALRHEAKRVLPGMLQQQALKYGFDYKEVKISSGKTRWGSCSSQKIINLSFYLLLLPEHLITYVLLHELCHTREMNHGKNFWQLLDSTCNNRAKALSNELKKISIRL